MTAYIIITNDNFGIPCPNAPQSPEEHQILNKIYLDVNEAYTESRKIKSVTVGVRELSFADTELGKLIHYYQIGKMALKKESEAKE